MTTYVFDPPVVTGLPIVDVTARFPVRRVYCVGRNYADHAVEMGHDPDREPPFFFQKNPDDLETSGVFPYPGASSNVHHEVELAVLLKSGSGSIPESRALAHVYGYAVALDMTRRDLQAEAKKAGRPWDAGKAFERSAPIGPVTPAADCGHLGSGSIQLTVNGQTRQSGDLDQMIWNVPGIISKLSELFVLGAGDVILTGTPAGVGPVQKGDKLVATISGLERLSVEVS
ncbi:FAA hydrolase family protein [Roseibium denhamense]|uniref:Fumarylpyruvate hydrolase n=1 Tax=Roseibium denhamense TaxID=76305 RepID=A0ABY1NF94_9HYPH|nr:fumarylacetoacetate hydrolase family protein [Roseibium denhamense]MTI06320.1 FAA hydrolase family protein [Roseibium denhamense]SMP08223.1 fumarylpyruvate hydrolase [Roseibium denhamense]